MQATEAGQRRTGILLYLLGVFLFAANDALGKWLVADYSVGEVMMVRSIGGVAILVTLAKIQGQPLLVAGQWGLQIARIIFFTLDTYCFFSGVQGLPLADVMTFYMAAPLIVTALSGPLLGEHVGPRRWAAVLLGFVGVVIALAPTSAAVSPYAFIALAGAFMFALALVITRKLRDNHWLPLVTWQFVGAGVVGAAASPFGWLMPDITDIGLMLLIGIVSSFCFICVTRALALTPASLLAPFQYTAIVWAGIMGWLVWRDVPTPRILLGNAIIIACGLFVYLRERQLGLLSESRAEPGTILSRDH
jgi:drug/metabolite transporter (DMT)-like permease